MKLRKQIAILVIIGATGMFAAGLSDVKILVDEINKTSDKVVKGQLIKKLNKELSIIDKKDLVEALEIVDTKLKGEVVISK